MSKISEGTTVASQDGDLVPIYRSGQATGTEYVVDVGEELADKLALAGGTMTGTLTLAGAPSSDLEAATKAYTDTRAADYVPLAGGTMTGALTLAGAPSSDLEAATKAYVDNNSGGAVFYDVTEYGALGDGTTDDQPAIAAAIAAALAAGGGVVYIPAGAAGIYAIGENADNNEIDDPGAGAPDDRYRFDVDDAHGIRLEPGVGLIMAAGVKLIVHPDADTSTQTRDEVGATQPNGNFTLVYAENGGDGFYVSGGEIDADVSGAANVSGGGEALNFKFCTDIRVTELTIRNSHDDGLDLDGCSNVVVNGCKFYNTGASGIHCAGGAVNEVTISNCYFEGCAWSRINNEINGFSSAGVDFVQGTNQVLSNCIFKNCARAVTLMQQKGTVVSGCSMINNLLVQPSHSTNAGETFDEPQIMIKGGVDPPGGGGQNLACYGLISNCHIQNNKSSAACIRAEDYLLVPGKAYGSIQITGCNIYAPLGDCVDAQFVEDVSITGCKLWANGAVYKETAEATDAPVFSTDYVIDDRGDSVTGVAPVIPDETPSPSIGETALVILDDGVQEYWTFTTSWSLTYTFPAGFRTGRDGQLVIANNYIIKGEITGREPVGQVIGNAFTDQSVSVTGVELNSTATDWIVTGNSFTGGGFFVNIKQATGAEIRDNSAPSATLKSNAQACHIYNNLLGKLSVESGNFINNDVTGNTVKTSVLVGSGVHSNFWHGNDGAGMLNRVNSSDVAIDPDLPQRGVATLSSGTATIACACAIDASRFRVQLSRQSANSSTAIGNLVVASIVDATSFDIVSLQSDGSTTETNDASIVYWEIDTRSN